MIASAATRDVEEFVTELRNLPEGWLAVIGAAGVLGVLWMVVWMYRREGRIGASMGVRMILAALRCAVLLTLAVIFLEPVRVRILRRWVDCYTIVLVDSSSSMDLADRYRDADDADRVKTALGVDQVESIRRSEVVDRLIGDDDRKFLRALAANNRVKLYTFSDEPELLAMIRASREIPTEPSTDGSTASTALGVADVSLNFAATGPSTNIERAVRRAVESVGSAPVAGVVIFSDGGFNEGAPPEETARFARDRQVPIYAVGVGDPSNPRNVRVAEMLAPVNAFKHDPFAVSAKIVSEGIEGQTVQVRLRERNATGGGEGRIVDSKDVLVAAGSAAERVVFERRQESVGRFVYSIEVPVLEGESVADDNSKQMTVNVIDSKTRVLVVAGGPSWDYRFVSRLLERDESVDVSCWLQSADLSAVRDGNTIIDHLPILAEELFKYDVLILMDADRSEFDEPWCRLVDTFVTEYGGGLLVTAARAHTPSLLREPALRPLHDLLPVRLDPDADLILNQVGHYQLASAPVQIPQTAFGHPILRLADDPVSTKLAWQGIGEVYWHYPVLRAKPAATVLMRHGDPRMHNSAGGHVLSAVQFVGAGRAGFIGFDGTWRWRRHGVHLFDRFWTQFVRYLAEGKLLGGMKRGMLLTERDQFSLGEAVTVTARLFDVRYEPLKMDQVTGRYQVEGEKTSFTLAARRDRSGWFEGRFVPDRTGAYRISLTMPGAVGVEKTEIAKEITVSRPNIEILRPRMDRDNLVTLAEQSAAGRYFDVDQTAELASLIPDLHEEVPIRSRPTALWDNWQTLTLLISLLSVEWFLRKWNRLL